MSRPERGHKRFSRTGVATRRPLTTVLIVGEGQETEPNDFRGLKESEDAVRRSFGIDVKEGKGGSPEAVVREALKHKTNAIQREEPYDEIWCVFDVEGLQDHESLHSALALAKGHGVNACLSNPCFEVWLLSHFLRSARYFSDGHAVAGELNQHWGRIADGGYSKSDRSVYRRIGHLTRTAIENARNVLEKDHQGRPVYQANSSTQVYLLVDHLLGGSQDRT